MLVHSGYGLFDVTRSNYDQKVDELCKTHQRQAFSILHLCKQPIWCQAFEVFGYVNYRTEIWWMGSWHQLNKSTTPLGGQAHRRGRHGGSSACTTQYSSRAVFREQLGQLSTNLGQLSNCPPGVLHVLTLARTSYFVILDRTFATLSARLPPN